MIRSYDHEALWLKAKLFTNRAMDEYDRTFFDEQALWASLALELLGKAALAKLSPLLIAEPTEDGKNILAAVGVGTGDASVTTVRASTVFKRCKRAFPEFNLTHATEIADARNEYLHNAGIGFGTLAPDKWWQRYWSAVSTLLIAQDKTIEDLVGYERQSVVEGYLEQNLQYTEQRLSALLERAKQRYLQKLRGDLPEKLQRMWQSQWQLSAGLSYSAPGTCPACGNEGLLEADDAFNERTEGYFDAVSGEQEVWGIADAVPDYFSCAHCQLVLDEYALLESAGIADGFMVEGEQFINLEAEYGND